ncbi:palmitoyltransferase hip14 [Anaeramoeba ignava]|uniref:Palmitoyltransferase n=1 Tax=Anaeramoeba ignava TaxID=1746090 RepID=A0A9Q0L5J6_ANAIG|nr:palmitoyltransferase hip14 [Anaeramoeba ignava]
MSSTSDNEFDFDADVPREQDCQLIYAAEKGDLAKVKELIHEQDADINAADGQGFTALHLCSVEKGSYEVFEYLVKLGANLDLKVGKQKLAPIHYAAITGDVRKIHLLVSNGAKPDIQNIDGLNALHMAAQEGYILACHYLLNSEYTRDHLHVNMGDTANTTPLHWASYTGKIDTVFYLLKNGASVDAVDIYGRTALHIACSQNHYEIVQQLVIHGSDLSVKNNEEKTPLASAQEKNYNEIVFYLIHIINGYGPSGIAGKLRDRKLVPYKKLISLGSFLSPLASFLLLFLLFYIFHFIIASIASGFLIRYFYYKSFWPKSYGINSRSYWEAGAAFACIFLTFVTWLFHLLESFFYDQKFYSIFLFFCGLGIFVLQYLVYSLDPGYITADKLTTSQFIYEIEDGMDARSFCSTCHIRRPLRSKHDKVANKCVSKYDHWCPWTYSPIGINTEAYLFFFLFLVVFSTLNFYFYAFKYLSISEQIPPFKSIFKFILAFYQKEKWLFFIFTMNIAFLYFEVTLLIERIIHIAKNLTINETLNLYKYRYFFDSNGLFSNPFDLGYRLNTLQFFKFSNQVNWSQMKKLSDIPVHCRNPKRSFETDSRNILNKQI